LCCREPTTEQASASASKTHGHVIRHTWDSGLFVDNRIVGSTRFHFFCRTNLVGLKKEQPVTSCPSPRTLIRIGVAVSSSVFGAGCCSNPVRSWPRWRVAPSPTAGSTPPLPPSITSDDHRRIPTAPLLTQHLRRCSAPPLHRITHPSVTLHHCCRARRCPYCRAPPPPPLPSLLGRWRGVAR
jgi:hypothetical protein